MDQLVLQYQREAESRVQALRRIELCLFGLTLLVLAAEGLWVFRPVVRRVSETISESTRAQGALRHS